MTLYQEYTLREQIADYWIHVAGVAFGTAALLGMIAIAAVRRDLLDAFALAIYGAALLGTFIASASYNLAAPSRRKESLRKLDHAAVYVAIAGTYTPFALKLRYGNGPALLAFVWAIAFAGIALNFWRHRRFERAAVALYLVQGWCFLAVYREVFAALGEVATGLLLVGGLLYTAGAVFHRWPRLPFHNAIWHGSVLVAAICHYAAVIVLFAP